MRILSIAIALFTLLAYQVQAQIPLTNLQTDLQSKLDQIVEAYQLPGMTFSVIFNEDQAIHLASGMADQERKQAMQPLDKMLSGSTGKMYVSAIALQLFAQKDIGLDDHIADYLSTYTWFDQLPNAKTITIRDLMRHTSGLPEYYSQGTFLEDLKKDLLADRSPEECIAYVLGKSPVHETAKDWSYSDTNYLLLGLIIEKVANKKYNYLLTTFLQTHGFEDTQPSLSRSLDGLIAGYVGSQNFFSLPEKTIENDKLMVNPSFEWTGGGVVSNTKDLAKLVKLIHEGDLLDSTSYQQLIQAVSRSNGQPFYQGYGLGTFVWNKGGDIRYGHSGFFPGYLSHVEYSTDHQYAIAIQTNTDEGGQRLSQYIYELDQIIQQHIDAIDLANIQNNFKHQEACWNKHDIECYMQAYAPNELIQTASRGGITYGYDNIISDYRKYFPKERMGNLYFDAMNTRKLATHFYFVTGRFNLKFSDRTELVQGYFSATLQRIGGKWYMITDHSS